MRRIEAIETIAAMVFVGSTALGSLGCSRAEAQSTPEATPTAIPNYYATFGPASKQDTFIDANTLPSALTQIPIPRATPEPSPTPKPPAPSSVVEIPGGNFVIFVNSGSSFDVLAQQTEDAGALTNVRSGVTAIQQSCPLSDSEPPRYAGTEVEAIASVKTIFRNCVTFLQNRASAPQTR